jgi:hypothetical protein
MPRKPDRRAERRKFRRALDDALALKQEISRRQLRMAEEKHAPRVLRRRVADARSSAVAQVHAVGIGRKIVDGKPTDTVSIRFYVVQKLPKRVLDKSQILPNNFDGIETDVIEAPIAYLAAAPPPCSVRRLRELRPAPGGVSGAHEAIAAGTLAALCRSRRADESQDRFVLGNSHTLADLGAAALGSAILQPAVRDNGLPAQRIAGLHRFVPVLEAVNAENRVDAAIGKLDNTTLMKAGVCGIGAVTGVDSALADQRVQKHGRTTGLTVGIVDDPSIDVLIPLRRSDPTRVTQFLDQIRIRPLPGVFVFAQSGDSGALVVSKTTRRAIGLLFACPDNGTFAYANPIRTVLDSLEIDLM